VRLRPQRCVLVLHGVRLERKVLQTVEASGLGGYLPCTLESMHVAELELVSTRRHTLAHPGRPLARPLAHPCPEPKPRPKPKPKWEPKREPHPEQVLQLVPLLRFAGHLLRQLTHRRSLAWKQERPPPLSWVMFTKGHEKGWREVIEHTGWLLGEFYGVLVPQGKVWH